MGALIRAHAWSGSSLGLSSGWPSTLHTLLGVMLDAQQPMFIAWGPERILLYNDAYAPLLGRKHPAALGQPFMAVWPEVRRDIEPLFDRVFAGQSVHMDDIGLVLERNGQPEEAHFAFSYTPVRDEAGGVLGLFCTCTDTTAQVFADRKKSAETERQRGLFERAPGFICIMHGPDHVFEFANHAHRRLFPRPEVVGKPVRQAFPELDGQGFYELLDRVYATGERFVARGAPARIRASLEAPEEERFLDFVYEPVKDEAGQVTGIFCEGFDVTETHRATEALRASEARLRELNADLEKQVLERAQARGKTWQLSPDLLGALNARGYFETSNPAWQTVLGWSEAEVAGMSIFEMLHPDDVERTREGFRLTQIGQPAIRFENRYRCKDGGFRWISWVGIPEEGLVYCTGRDITEEKRQAEELAQRTAEHDHLWESSPDLLVVLDFEGIFRRVNPAWSALLGFTPGELLGTRVDRLVHRDDVQLTEDALQRAKGAPLFQVENRYCHKDGSHRWFSWVAAPWGDRIFATGRHITAEKEQAAALADAEEALRQSQKMEAIGQLTGGLAHDFNNLLTGIGGSLELLTARIAQGRFTDVDRYCQAALGATRRAAALTQRMLAFSRRQTLDPKPTNVNRLIGGMEELIRRTVGPAITMEVVGAAGLWPALVDPNQLENALLNLCINARDAMPDGGRITIETANKWLDGQAGRERDLPPGQYLSLCVTDTGIGMPPEVIARAFDPFYTTKPIGLGTGLGLSMVYGFARQSNGQVRIYSEIGKGTTMCLYLPRHLGAEGGTGGTEMLEGTPRAEPGETVLVVDDEPTVRMLVTEVLADLGYTAIEAADGAAGLKVLRSDTRIDLLVTDVGLPGGMNGRQLADAARTSRPNLKVLFITGYAENAVLNHGHLDHGMHVLTKPFAMDMLAKRMKEIIAG